MANLIIKKSDTENISIPLTTEKPIARSLAIFKDGEVYYNPLVRAGEYLDSGINVCIDGSNYALSTEIYDPVLYDSTGEIWTPSGIPVVHQRGYLELDGSSYLTCNKTLSLSKTSYFEFRCKITPTAVRGISQCIFSIFVNSSTYFSLFIQPTNKLAISLNTTSIKTTSVTLTENEEVTVGFWHDNGKFDLYYNYEYLGEVTKNITTGTYKARIGANVSGENRFIGKISDVIFYSDSTSKKMRFGN